MKLSRPRRCAPVLTRAILLLCIALGLSPSVLAQDHHGHHAPSKVEAKPAAKAKPVADTAAGSSGKLHPTSTEGLPVVKPTEVVELADGALYEMTAAPVKQLIGGRWIRRLAYNGMIPGPTLKVRQGSTARVRLKNQAGTDTTLHPHGLRVDDKNDGVPGIGQPPIRQGGEHLYTLRFPDPGMYWYHPHVREDYAQELGLYGNFWVQPAEASHYNTVHREVPLVLDDASTSPEAPFYEDKVTHTLMGRFGDSMLVNGVEGHRIEVLAGEAVRFFITNTANARTFVFAIAGTRLKLVGGDNGLYEEERWLDRLIIGPSERYIVEAFFDKPGERVLLNDKPGGAVPMATVAVVEGKAKITPLPRPFEQLRPRRTHPDLEAVRAHLGAPVKHRLRLTLSMDHAKLPMDHGSHGSPATTPASKAARPSLDDRLVSHPEARVIEWDDEMPAMNAKSDDGNVVWKMIDEDSGRENMAIDWPFKRGDYVKIRIVNDPRSMHPMQHPIHFHGNRFVIASVDGEPVKNLVWKDSALVAAGETMDIVLEASNPGRWMAHCHISEHLGAGMMIGFRVLP